MSKKTIVKPVAIALGATFATSLAGTTVSNAAENPFSMQELSAGYMLAEQAEGKCGSGEKKAEEGKCGEGKCGEGKCGSSETKAKEGKCGEGKCGEGKCGSSETKAKEGKCGGSQ
jgi:uncharacterized low-complexity protein